MAWTSCMVTFFLGIFLGLLTPGVTTAIIPILWNVVWPSMVVAFYLFFVINVICHELNRVRVRRFREIDSMEYRSTEFKLSNFPVGCTETKVTQGIYQKS